MKIAFISDIHGNLPAFEMAMEDIEESKVEKIYFLGDAFGYFSDGEIIIKKLLENNIDCLLGNHDAMVMGYLPIDEIKDKVYCNNIQKSILSNDSVNIVSSWLPFKNITIDNKKILLLHGSPTNPLLGYIYPDSNFKEFLNLPFDIFIMGHTHYPFNISLQGKRIINSGSIGLPRDIGNLGSYIIWETDTNIFKIQRFELPIPEMVLKYKNIHNNVKSLFSKNAK